MSKTTVIVVEIILAGRLSDEVDNLDVVEVKCLVLKLVVLSGCVDEEKREWRLILWILIFGNPSEELKYLVGSGWELRHSRRILHDGVTARGCFRECQDRGLRWRSTQPEPKCRRMRLYIFDSDSGCVVTDGQVAAWGFTTDKLMGVKRAYWNEHDLQIVKRKVYIWTRVWWTIYWLGRRWGSTCCVTLSQQTLSRWGLWEVTCFNKIETNDSPYKPHCPKIAS